MFLNEITIGVQESALVPANTMENFNANQSFITKPLGDVKPFPLDPIWPDGTRRSEPESFASPSLLPEQVPIQLFAGDNLFAGQIQEAIAPQIGPPLPGQPPGPPADPIVGGSFTVNQEAVNFTMDGNNSSADGTPWHLRSDVNPDADANITNVWDQDVRGRNVVIGILDNGFEIDDPDKNLSGHPDLLTNYREDLSYDFDEEDAYPSRLLNSTIAYSGSRRTIRNSSIVGSSFIMDVPLSGGLVKELKLNLEIAHEAESGLDVFLLAPKEYSGQSDKDRPQAKLLTNVGNGEYSLVISKDFLGLNAGGSWKLKIKDKKTKDGKSGTLLDWSLEFETLNSHGTAVAGVAAASGDNGIISGVAPEAKWAGLRMGADGTDDEEIAEALSHKNDEIHIYNNSWGTGFFQEFPAAERALADAVNNGRGGLGNIYVFSGGNAQQDDLGHPHSNVNYNSLANSRHTIAVAAIDHEGKQALYSEPGAPLLVSAYSSSGREGDRAISTTGPYSDDGNDENDYNHGFGGTSASAPFVSGVIALMLEAKSQLTSRDVQHILVETAQKNDPSDDDWSENGAGYHVNHKYGFGAIDAEAAVELAGNWTSVGEEISVSRREDTDLPIPNYNPEDPLTSTITINDDMTIEWVEVEFDATHNYLGQLEIVLISPDGTESVLAEGHGNGLYTGDDDSYDWTFTSARNWGESAVGDWTLQVWDRDERIPSDDNFWNSWELNIYGTQPTVSVEATDPDASEDGDSGQFTFTRTGNTTHPLTVNYSASGTATACSDYSTIGEIVFLAGSSEVTVAIAPIDDDEVESDETVEVVLNADGGYNIGTESSATVNIADNDIVLSTLPVANNDFAIAITGKSVTIPVLDSDSDPNGDTLSITGVSTPTNGNVSIFDNGTTADSSDDQIIYTGNTAGVTDTFTYTITDGNGGTDTATVSVGVFNDANGTSRSITGDGTGNVIVGSSGTVQGEQLNGGSGNDILIGGPGQTQFTGNVGADEFRFLAADSGTLGLGIDYITDFDPITEQDKIRLAFQANSTGVSVSSLSIAGFFSLTIADTSFYLTIQTDPTITDAQILNAIEYGSSVTCNEPEHPVANNDSVTIAQGTTQTLSAGLTSNDSDPNGDSFSIVGVTTPTNGGTANVTGGQVIYTAPDSATTDTFTYSIADGTGTDSATVTVSVISGSTLPAAVIHTASYNGHTYHLLDTDGTKWWQEAEAEANSLGGHLVTINDAAENQWVLDTFGPIALTYANDNNLPDRDVISLWVGLSDHLNEGTYQWSSGQSNEYRNWDFDQPQDFFDDEDFAGISVNFGTLGKWHDIVGNTRLINLPFGVVEVENDSPPPTKENDFLLVSSFLSDEVLRYDATTGEFIDEFVSAGSGGLDGPDGLALGPDGNLYVSSQITDQVLRYDGTTGAFIDVFAFGGGLDAPIEITFGPDDNLYVSSAGTDQVLRYDGTTGAFIDVFASGGGLDGPIEITFGPDGNLYVSSFVTDQVFQILRYNGTTGAFLDVFISGEGLTGINRGLTFGPDDNLYLTSSLSDYVLRYDGTTGEFIDEFVPAGSGGLDFPHDIKFGPDGNVYVSSAITGSVLRYDDTTGAFLDVFASGGGLDGPIDLVFVDDSSSL